MRIKAAISSKEAVAAVIPILNTTVIDLRDVAVRLFEIHLFGPRMPLNKWIHGS